MKRLIPLFLLSFAVRAEIKERIAAVVNGQPVTLSEVEERVGPELARLPPGPAGEAQRKELLRRGLEQLIDERLVESEASALGLDIPEDEIQHLIDQLAKQNNMDTAQFRDAIAAQGISFDTVRDTLRRQQLMMRLLQYKVKPRKVSDEEVQAAYATMTAEGEVEVRARHIFISAPDGATPARLKAAEEKAQLAFKRVQGGETFAKVARDLSDGPTAREGGDMGYFKRGQLQPALDKAAFSLQPGQMSGLIRTTGEHGGWHILLVEDRRKVAAKPLAEVQEEIRTRLAGDSIIKEREHYLASLRKSAQIDVKL
jgi:peptidyl-prolyl cis-trans isomerase SurA